MNMEVKDYNGCFVYPEPVKEHIRDIIIDADNEKELFGSLEGYSYLIGRLETEFNITRG
jgi:hypothetical protein